MSFANAPEGLHWLPEYDATLENIVSTDAINVEWDKLREIIKARLKKNIDFFLATYPKAPPAPSQFAAVGLETGGLKLAPFAPQKPHPKSPIPPPVSYMSEEQARQMQEYVFNQLGDFEASPPFTIQRVCELCLQPDKHYKSVGKYLRAVEKSLLVTSTVGSFPSLPEGPTTAFPTRSTVLDPQLERGSAPSTPLFSPIPFLHGDARRSPSPSPGLYGGSRFELPELLEPKALGLVDELDDPSPGHLSDHPVALTTTTTSTRADKPLRSLEDRFVKESEAESSEKDTQGGEATKERENKT